MNDIALPFEKPRPNRKVGFKVAWSHYRVGDVIEPSGTLRDWLVQNGYAVTVPRETPTGLGKFDAEAWKKEQARAAAKPKRGRYINRAMAAE